MKRSDDNPARDINGKVAYLKAKMKESSYHQDKAKLSKTTDLGYDWIYIIKYLQSLDDIESFERIMESKYFSQIEKDFIIFNINKLKRIARWPAWKFKTEVKIFEEEIKRLSDEDDDDGQD